MGFVEERPKAAGSKLFREQILTVSARKWLKSYEVEKLLGISPGTLQTFRNNGTIPYTKIGGTIYYDPADIEKVLQDKKTGFRKMGLPFHR